MRTTVRLLGAALHYPPELSVHTAVSGRIDSLAALYLVIERNDGWQGTGEVRANIEYLTGLPAQAVAPAIRTLVRGMGWHADLPAALDAAAAPALARAAVESALVDGAARAEGRTAAACLGGAPTPAVPTNQCLFWGPDLQFEALARRYLEEGFTELKVRIGIGTFEQDLVRLARLRELCGDAVAIAVDANGAWDGATAVMRLRQLEPFRLVYVEQPTTPGDWAAFDQAVGGSPVPLMLDEGLAAPADVEGLCRRGGRVLAHLKIAKFGGPRAVVAAARRLADAGVGVMVGQMNEGAMATAMAAHCAMAVRPLHAELYGCYGLLDDRATGIAYRAGQAWVDAGTGHGATLDERRCEVLWEERFR